MKIAKKCIWWGLGGMGILLLLLFSRMGCETKTSQGPIVITNSSDEIIYDETAGSETSGTGDRK